MAYRKTVRKSGGKKGGKKKAGLRRSGLRRSGLRRSGLRRSRRGGLKGGWTTPPGERFAAFSGDPLRAQFSVN